MSNDTMGLRTSEIDYEFDTEVAAMKALHTRSEYGIVYRTIDGTWSWALEGSWVGLACEYLVKHNAPNVGVMDLQGKQLFVIEYARFVRPRNKNHASA